MAVSAPDRAAIEGFVNALFESPDNLISQEAAAAPEDIGQRYFDAPVIRIGSAEDSIWESFKAPEAVGSIYKAPKDWLPNAKSVISVFAPASAYVRKSNAQDPVWPGSGWIAVYNSGSAMLKRFGKALAEWLREQGFDAVSPGMDPGFLRVLEDGTNPKVPSGLAFTSNWSERHAAYACGMGTFGLSRGIITPKGMAGRFTSVITALPLEADLRLYEGLYDYCIMCGKCIKNCPANAISKEKGKEHIPCNQQLLKAEEHNGLSDCCGKCQVKVPCEGMIPNPKFRKALGL